MKLLTRSSVVSGLFGVVLMTPVVASAASFPGLACHADSATCGVIKTIVGAVLNPILGLIFGAALVVFIYGVAEYLWKIRKGESTKDSQLHMWWGLVGLFIITAAVAILNMIANTVQALFP